MNITTKPVDPYTIDARIELGQEELLHALQHTKEQIAQDVQVEGFRKGKAPQHLIDQQLNADAVRAEALEHALEESFGQAATEQKWDIIKTDKLNIEENSAQRLVYTVRVYVYPEVTLPSLEGVSVQRTPLTVTDLEIDEALDTIRTMRAQFIEKPGHAAQDDRVEIDFDASVDGEPVEGGSERGHALVIGGKNFMPGFEEQLIGLASGEEKTFSLEVPPEYPQQKLAGKTVKFVATMRRVQSVLKPVADDAFAASLGSFTSLSQLRQSLREGIANEKTIKEQQRVRLAMLDAIIAAGNVPAPEFMAREELDDMIHRFSHDLKSRNVELSMYLARAKKTEEDLRREWMPEAERQTRIMLVLRATAKANGIHVEKNELDEAVNEAIGQMIRSGQATEDQVDPERARSAISERMLTEKTLRFLEDRCVVA